MIKLIVCFLCVFSQAFSAESYDTEKKVDQLQLLIQKRLVIMHEVARTKWNQNLAIEDKAREGQILATLVEQSSKSGLDQKWITKFFQAQMHAAKEIQKSDFAAWNKAGVQKFDKVLSLKDELRLYIDQINQEMIGLLSDLNGKSFSEFVLAFPISNRESDHIDDLIWQQATAPLY